MRSAHGRTAMVKMAAPVRSGAVSFQKLIEYTSVFQKVE
jgi:hypothetical protein